jgi:hypothetical protein
MPASSLSLPGDGPQVLWSRTFGGPYDDGIWSLEKTDDGGYLMAGNTASLGQMSDLFLIKTNSTGVLLWNRSYGGSGEDAGYLAIQTKDGGCIVTGSSGSYGLGEERLWLLKTDSNGSRIWDRVFGGFVSSSGDGGWSVDETDDGGYIVAGYTQSKGMGHKDLWLLKIDEMGQEIWDRTFGGAEDDVGMSVLQTRDGGYIVAGRAASFGHGGDDIWLLKTDSQGQELWNKTFGGANDDAAFQVQELSDGYALVGRTESGIEGKRIILIRTNLDGKMVWEQSYSGSSGTSLQSTSDGGFIIAGRVDNKDSGRDAKLIKTDARGALEWEATLGKAGDEMGTFVVQSSEWNYVMAGITNSNGEGAEDAWLIKIQMNSSQNKTPEDESQSASSGMRPKRIIFREN